MVQSSTERGSHFPGHQVHTEHRQKESQRPANNKRNIVVNNNNNNNKKKNQLLTKKKKRERLFTVWAETKQGSSYLFWLACALLVTVFYVLVQRCSLDITAQTGTAKGEKSTTPSGLSEAEAIFWSILGRTENIFSLFLKAEITTEMCQSDPVAVEDRWHNDITDECGTHLFTPFYRKKKNLCILHKLRTAFFISVALYSLERLSKRILMRKTPRGWNKCILLLFRHPSKECPSVDLLLHFINTPACIYYLMWEEE